MDLGDHAESITFLIRDRGAYFTDSFGALSLQSTLGRVSDLPQVSERIQRVDDLDDTIKIIRSTIYALREHDQSRRGSGLRAQLVAATERATESLGFTPALRMTGLLDTRTPAPFDVTVEVADTELKLRVADNGSGIDPAINRRSGLANLSKRAEELGGSFSVSANQPSGTVVEWTVPL
ncbi:sensor histidine kinase [Streptomyces sp. NEAU-174]|uniref:sensor histidine kinase n=1 Tax=Streptomyces sp. NEAU-174 TaxID=3458254 RepID=UPI004044DAB2